MSKKIGLISTYFFIFIITFYFSSNAAIYNRTMNEYIASYLGNFQTYFFVFTQLLLPIILFNHIHYLKPEYVVRMKNSLFIYIIKKIMEDSIQIILLIFAFFFVSGFLLRLPFEMDIFLYISLFFQFYIYIIAIFLFYHTLYVLLEKYVLALFIIVASNLIVNTGTFGFRFIFIYDDYLDQILFYIISWIYFLIIIIVSLVSLLIITKRKECYS